MGQRAYRRDSRGRFAGSGSATKTTVGRAGGWANAAHQQRAQAARAQARQSPPRPGGNKMRQRVSEARARAQTRRQERKRRLAQMTPAQRLARQKKINRRIGYGVLALSMMPGPSQMRMLGQAGRLFQAEAGLAMRGAAYNAGKKVAARRAARAFAESRGITSAMSIPRTAKKVRGAFRVTSLR